MKYSSDKVMKFFYEISNIPRGSGKEKQISDYLVKFAKDRNLEVYQDEYLNVLIKKEASKGYENFSPIVLQGHMDMVWEKNKNKNFDFETEGIKTYIDENGFLKADGTTLGADNGIAVAMIMALLDSDEYKHPKLEMLITSDEEVGMTGATNFDLSKIEGKTLINIDTEEDDKIYVSSAGGTRIKASFNLKKERVDISDKIFKLEITGLKGGHSGAEIHLGLGNSNKMMTEILKHIMIKYEICIIEIFGGNKDNAIPREAEVIFTTPDAIYETLNEDIKMICQILNYGLEQDEKLVYELKELENHITDKIYKIEHKETLKLINYFTHFPNGVQSMSKDIKGLVQTSLNMSVVKTIKEDEFIKVSLTSLLRSSNKKELLELRDKLVNLTNKFEGIATEGQTYMPWEYKENSNIRPIIAKAFKEVTNQDVELSAIHAGLECGLFAAKREEFDIISIGPNIYGAHTPDERMELKSVDKIWNILLTGLEKYDIK